MPRAQKFKVARVAEALRQGGGIYTAAASILKCSPNTVKNYVERNANLQQVKAEVEDMTLDLAETKLIMAIRDGNMNAVTFYLRTKGRARGYGDKLELAGKVKTATIDLSTASDEQVRRWAAWDDDEAEPAADPSKV